ncbi:DNA gyrase subunit A [Candidatus Kaiserbacteria bacterium CG10_big_fil_rev_8_21_14_0_10_49_17]|uniref:DNA gyrase subunit A n=1 Tax=Candidatus Kaiserbacteria bacterium CG10_big_fil_rev_8_21_14_0_10_49_17 TaxID=1974609 RepID=A0A2M6WDQ6_9BACT|nr:MAG: DNA gyrase subunit A [Candidatus Kaiserbacteria bacterium CG10_big_fil_rev_8_21_14_0_10_49_17]
MAKKESEKEPAKQAGARVVEQSISSEMKESYLDYAMSVITSRALPDVRDGLKPVHRRILYTMHQMGLSSNARYRKSAAVVGDVMGKYHPHGDSAIYDALAKLAQDFNTRYTLVDGQGNFGSIDGDPPAAMRYTEAKMDKLSGELLRDIEKDTVDFKPNYDATKLEPAVLPAAVPQLLLNGTLGIAVGMATNIPPHNLREVCDATVHLIENPKATTDDLLQFVHGPDFPVGGIAFNKKDIEQAYATGRGGVVVRGVAEITEDKKGAAHIIITSIPFRVNKAELLIKIADLVRDKKIDGIKDIRDESTDDIRVVIDLKGSGHPQNILNYLYKHTQLEETFHYNMVALVDGVPQTLSLKSVLEAFIKHRVEVITRRARFDLAKAEAREHILLGLKKALDHIDEIIKLIKKALDVSSAHAALMKQFAFSEIQATAILEMRLQKLAGLERKKIEDELKDIQALIKALKTLLASEKKILGVVRDELVAVAEKFGDERRTKIVTQPVKSLSLEDLVPDEESVMVLTKGGYIKRTSPDEFRKQKRGGVGVIDLNTKEEDFVTTMLTASTHSDLLFFTDRGKAYQMKMYELPEGRRATKGKSIMNFISLDQNERVTSVLPISSTYKKGEWHLMMVTKEGVVKKVDATSFQEVRRSGLIAIKLATGDELISTHFVGEKDTVSIVTAKGQSIRFNEKDVRAMGRSAAGVRAIKLSKGDNIIGAGVARSTTMQKPELMVLSETGYGKKTPLSEYKVQKRGGSGIKTANVSAKTGDLITAAVVDAKEEGELVAISQKGQVIRIDQNEIPTLGRQTQGVRVMKLRAGDKIASFICV